MGLMGTLETMALADLLQWVSTAKKAGVVKVTHGKKKIQLSVGGARVLGTYSNEPPMLLGQFLLSRGKIDEDTLHDALTRQDATREHLGKVLIESNAISKDELERYVVLKAEETIFAMLDWTEAMFEFDSSIDVDPRMVPMNHGIDDLIMRGAQRLDEMARIRTVLGDPGVVLCRTEIELPEQAQQSPMAARVYNAIDGRRTMEDILLQSRASEYFAMKFLFELHRAGVVRIKDIQESKPEPGSPKAIIASAQKMIEAHQFDGAIALITASLKVFPENSDIQQLLTKAETGYLEYAYQSRIAPHWVPRMVMPIEIAVSQEDLGANERFILDLTHQGKWSVKAMTRIAPLHEVDVVRSTLSLLDKKIIELVNEESDSDLEQINEFNDQLRRMSDDMDIQSVEDSINNCFGESDTNDQAVTTDSQLGEAIPFQPAGESE